LNNKNHTLIINDARNYLLKNNQKYDVIIQEPSDPWQAFSTNLYSKEFLEIVGNHLNENGLYVKWVPIYTMTVEDFQNFYKTFDSVFPNNIAFANIKSDEDTPVKFETSQILLIGSKNEIEFNKTKINENYDSLPSESRQYLDAIGLSSGNEISHLLLFTDKDIQNYAENAKIVTDDNLLLEFSTAKKTINQNPRAIIDGINNFIKKDVE